MVAAAPQSTPLLTDPGAVGRAVRRVLLITLILNVLVSLGKILIGLLSDSLAMVADGYHSLADGANNVVGLIVAAIAFAPPDSAHPYGHRKFETAATGFIGVALILTAAHVLSQALSSAEHAQPRIGALNWAVMLVTLVVNVVVTLYETREGRRLGSEYLIADSAHTRADIFVSLGVVLSFLAVRSGLGWADPAVALAIAGVIAYQALRILIGAFNVLTDRAAIAPETIAQLLEDVPDLHGWRDIRTRGGAGAVYVDLTVQVDGALTLRAAHDIADRIEVRVKQTLPDVVDVVVHVEPAVDQS